MDSSTRLSSRSCCNMPALLDCPSWRLGTDEMNLRSCWLCCWLTVFWSLLVPGEWSGFLKFSSGICAHTTLQSGWRRWRGPRNSRCTCCGACGRSPRRSCGPRDPPTPWKDTVEGQSHRSILFSHINALRNTFFSLPCILHSLLLTLHHALFILYPSTVTLYPLRFACYLLPVTRCPQLLTRYA